MPGALGYRVFVLLGLAFLALAYSIAGTHPAALGSEAVAVARDREGAQGRSRWSVVEDRPLPDGLSGRDIRWGSEASVVVAAGIPGVFELSAQGAESAPKPALTGFWFADRLALSKSLFVAAAPVNSLAWKLRQEVHPERWKEAPIAIIADIDAHGGRVAVLGADRDQQGRPAPDGVIAWVDSLSAPDGERRPIVFSSDGPGVRSMAFCDVLELGRIRFLGDGSLLVVPGVEPGIYLFKPDFRLGRTWPTEELGFVDRCEVNEEESLALAADPDVRWPWLDRRVVLDEILPLPEGPGLVLRRVEGDVTHWEVVILDVDHGGVLRREPLPVTAPTARAHLRGDVRGGRLALLVVVDGLPDEPAPAPSRLVLLERPKASPEGAASTPSTSPSGPSTTGEP